MLRVLYNKMEEVYTYLFNTDVQRAGYVPLSKKEIGFMLNRDVLNVSFHFTDELEFDNYVVRPSNENFDFKKLDRKITKIIVSGYEYLGYREEAENGLSLSLYYFDLLRALYSSSYHHYIKSLNLTIQVSEGAGYCETDDSYEYEITFASDLANDLNFFQYLKKASESIRWKGIFNDYLSIYHSKKKVDTKDKQFAIPIISTNTKVRRLGYVKLFSNLLASRKGSIPVNLVNTKFEEYVNPFSSQLKNRQNDKGLIQELKGRSATPYIEFFNQLGLINVVNRLVVPVKEYKVYNKILETYPNNDTFDLNLLDKIFFLENLLIKDFLYFSSLIELIYLRGGDTHYHNLRDDFQSYLLSKLEGHKSNLLFSNAKEARQVQEIVDRINDWKKPKVYLEHLIMPRLNWLADLEMITLTNNRVVLNEKGRILFVLISQLNDLNMESIINPTNYLDSLFCKIFKRIYLNEEPVLITDRNEIIQKVEKLIETSFNSFQTLAPNRVTASLSITYAKYLMLLNFNVALDFNEIRQIVEENLNDKFIYKYQPQYEDGYIQRRNYEFQR